MSGARLAAAQAQLHGTLDWDDFDGALATARESGDRLGEAAVHHLRTVVHASLPDPDVVASDLSRSVAVLAEIGARPFLAETLRKYGLVPEGAGRVEQAEEIIRRAGAVLAEMESVADR